jgi:hypothetical protein
MRVMTRPLALLALVVGTAGCGGSSDAAPPRLPREVASALAARSDAIARTLDAGDPCRAAVQARALRSRTIAAVNARRIPRDYQEELLGAVQELVASTEEACSATPSPPPPTQETTTESTETEPPETEPTEPEESEPESTEPEETETEQETTVTLTVPTESDQ